MRGLQDIQWKPFLQSWSDSLVVREGWWLEDILVFLYKCELNLPKSKELVQIQGESLSLLKIFNSCHFLLHLLAGILHQHSS